MSDPSLESCTLLVEDESGVLLPSELSDNMTRGRSPEASSIMSPKTQSRDIVGPKGVRHISDCSPCRLLGAVGFLLTCGLLTSILVSSQADSSAPEQSLRGGEQDEAVKLLAQDGTQTFYTYKAIAEGAFWKYPFGNTNTGNLEGVMWYLGNEVVTQYSHGTQCPRKFNIAKIRRFKITTKVTPALAAKNMHFGARFAFDFGKCMGRCFDHNMCTGSADCDFQYSNYGFNPGCNNFGDKSAYPDYETSAPGGIWYSFPLEGRCAYPTGADNCTWSFEEAGDVTLAELEQSVGGGGNCCNGICSGFWDGVLRPGKTQWRIQLARDLFTRKYPAIQAWNEHAPMCDFRPAEWYAPDTWPRGDPWKTTTAVPGY